MRDEKAIVAIIREYDKASEKFGAFSTPHEGYAVILEELDELWDSIKNKAKGPKEMKEEAIQVGAMALRFLVDCIPED